MVCFGSVSTHAQTAIDRHPTQLRLGMIVASRRMERFGMHLASTKRQAHVTRDSIAVRCSLPPPYAVADARIHTGERRVGVDTRDLHCCVGHDGAGSKAPAISNNLANVSTPGFKRDIAVGESFSDIVSGLARSPVGRLGMSTAITAVYSDHSPGSMANTQNPFDLAIEGDGMFLRSKLTQASGTHGPATSGWMQNHTSSRGTGTGCWVPTAQSGWMDLW